MRFLLSFKKLEADMGMCPMSDEQKAALMQFHTHLLNHCGHQMELAEEEETAAPQETEMSWSEKLLQLVMKKSAEKKEDEEDKNRLPSEKYEYFDKYIEYFWWKMILYTWFDLWNKHLKGPVY